MRLVRGWDNVVSGKFGSLSNVVTKAFVCR